MNNLVLWYDNEKRINCEHKEIVYQENTILEKLNLNNIEYETKTTDNSLDLNNLNVYIIELCNVYAQVDIFDLIPKQTKDLFKQGLNIVLYYPREGHSLDDWLFDFYLNLEKHKLLSCNIFLVYGDADIEKNYDLFLKKYNIDDFLIPITVDYFKGDYFEKTNQFNNCLNSQKKYDFLFYNGKMRPHRLLSVSELYRRKIIKNGLVSLTATTHTGESYSIQSCVDMLEKYNANISYIKEYVKNWKPLILDQDANSFDENTVNKNNLSHYCSTYFSIVSETNVTYRFRTEKTYKPIANLHPFLILSAPNTLQLLREQGYQTFPEIFDESYDLEEDHVKRVLMVINEVEKFTNLTKREKYKKIQAVSEKLTHNKNHYIRTAKETKKQDIEKIFKVIKNVN